MDVFGTNIERLTEIGDKFGIALRIKEAQAFQKLTPEDSVVEWIPSHARSP
jgi:hypothetical protein